MKILITGSNGLLGQKLVKLITEETNHELIATARGKIDFQRSLDIFLNPLILLMSKRYWI